MKKLNLKVGLLTMLIAFTISTPQVASAFSIKDLLFTQTNNDSSSSAAETADGQVLSTETVASEDNNSAPQTATVEETDSNLAKEVVNNTVVVIAGDSLSKIAKAHNTTYLRIFYANESIKDPNIISPGQSIRIPTADEQLVERDIPAPIVAKVKSSTSAKISNKSNASSRTRQTPATPAPAVADGSVWDRLAQCESGGRWNINTGNGYYGGLQFNPNTWRAVGGTGLPHEHSREEQIRRAEILLARSGWGQWPACTKKLGLR